jgi:hypothetical protein
MYALIGQPDNAEKFAKTIKASREVAVAKNGIGHPKCYVITLGAYADSPLVMGSWKACAFLPSLPATMVHAIVENGATFAAPEPHYLPGAQGRVATECIPRTAAKSVLRVGRQTLIVLLMIESLYQPTGS